MPYRNTPNTEDNLLISSSVTTVAVMAISGGATYCGIIGSDTLGRFVTNTAWVCTGQLWSGWMLPEFDDSCWLNATVTTDSRFIKPASISASAKLVWLSPYSSTVYCRYSYCK